MKNKYNQKVGAFAFFCLFSFFSFNLFAQVGIGNTDPKTMLDVSGALSLREGPALNLTNGENIDIDLGTTVYSNYRIVGPTADFSINGITGVTGADGLLVTLVNSTDYSMIITSNSSGGGLKIVCPSDFDLLLTGTNSSVTLQYNTSLAKWIVVGYSDLGGYGRNVYNSIGTTDINTNSTAFSDMADMSITFTPKHSVVYVNFSASGTMDKGASFDSNAYANFQLRNGATSIAGTTTLATDRSNYNNCVINSFPYNESFDDPPYGCWSEEHVLGNEPWYAYAFGAGGGGITTTHSGAYNLLFQGTNNEITKFISPLMDISGLTTPTITFWHGQQSNSGQKQLRVYYRISETDPWVQIASYTNNVTSWTQRTLALPNASSTYQIAFEGRGNNGGRPVVVDDMTVTGAGAVNTRFLETAWNAGFTMYPVSVTPGVSTTINLRWLRDGNFPNVLRNNVQNDADRSHRNLTILD